MHHDPSIVATILPAEREAEPVRFAGIDALRGIAALAVCLFHWEHIGFGTPVNAQAFRFGLLGVELFFMISGFVIALVAARSRSVPGFLMARAVRLYPAYLASVLLTALYVLPTGKHDLATVLVNATMLQSFVDVPNITNPYWTLAFEVTFYGLFAGLLAARAFDRIEGIALAWLACTMVYRLAVPGPLGFDDARPLAQLGYILVAPQFAPFFVIGVLMDRVRRGCLGVVGQGAMMVALGLTLFGRSDFAQVSGVAYAGAACAMAAALRLAAAGFREGGLAVRILGGLGILSYPLYLVHCTVANLCVTMSSPWGIPPAAAVAVSAPLSLALALALHRGIERPAMAAFRRTRTALSSRPAALGPACP